MLKKIRITLFCILILTTLSINAQITIGSNVAPVKGALLDLKEFAPDQNNMTATKGMGLPRVELTAINTLKPAVSDHVEGTTDETHIGLLVYNTNLCIDGGAGIYVWTGEEWKIIGSPVHGTDHTAFDENTGILTDFEGNQYPTMVFNGKRWTTTNSRSIRQANGEFIDCTDGLRLNPGYYSNGNGAIVVKSSIPDGFVGAVTEAGVSIPANTKTYSEWADTYGLSYTKEQAAIACPRGWHLASEGEWTDLMNYMSTTYTASSYGHSMKGNTNKTYKSVDSSLFNWTGGVTTTESGFNLLPAGWVRDDGTTANGFSISVYFWMGSNGKYGYLGNTNGTVSTFLATFPFRFSVRCVQD